MSELKYFMLNNIFKTVHQHIAGQHMHILKKMFFFYHLIIHQISPHFLKN